MIVPDSTTYGSKSLAEVGCVGPTNKDINRLLRNTTQHNLLSDYILLKIAGVDDYMKTTLLMLVK